MGEVVPYSKFLKAKADREAENWLQEHINEGGIQNTVIVYLNMGPPTSVYEKLLLQRISNKLSKLWKHLNLD